MTEKAIDDKDCIITSYVLDVLAEPINLAKL